MFLVQLGAFFSQTNSRKKPGQTSRAPIDHNPLGRAHKKAAPLAIQFLKKAQKYLNNRSSSYIDETTLLRSLSAAQQSIDIYDQNLDKEIVFGILLDIIEKCEKINTTKSVFFHQDENGLTALHWLVVFKNEWKDITEKVLLAAPEVCHIPDKNSIFPLSLAADKGAFDTFLMLANHTKKPDAWAQCLQAPFQEKFMHRKKEEIDVFIKENPDPTTVKVACLVAKHHHWQKAYVSLKEQIENKEDSEATKVEKVNSLLQFPTKLLPIHLETSFPQESWVVHLFVLLSCSNLFNFLLNNQEKFEYLKKALLSPCFLNVYSNACVIWLDLTIFLLKSSQFNGYIKGLPFAQQLEVLGRLAAFCGVPTSERLNLQSDNTSLERKNLLETLQAQIKKWAPEKIMIDTVFSLFGRNVNELLDILKKEPKGLSENKIEEIIKIATHDKQLMRPTDKNGNTVLHLAYFYEAPIVTTAFLRKIANVIEDPETSDMSDDSEMVKISDDLEKAITKALIRKNRAGEIPYELCATYFADKIQSEVICHLLEGRSISKRIQP